MTGSTNGQQGSGALDKRQFQRIRHTIPVDIKYLDRYSNEFHFTGKVRDFSVCGVGIELRERFWVVLGPRMRAELSLTTNSGRIDWTGYMARIVEEQDGASLIGLVFDRPRYDLLATMKDHIQLTVHLLDDLSASRKVRSSRLVDTWNSLFKGK